MRSAKSIPSLNNINNNNPQQQTQMGSQGQFSNAPNRNSSSSSVKTGGGGGGGGQPSNGASPTSPICRCRVMYLGSSVPHITKDGLQGIQEPLKKLYPDKASLDSGSAGIDSWLSVWSNGILIENVDETGREVKRFFKIDALHYCAAVKYIPTANGGGSSSSSSNNNQQQPQTNNGYATLATATVSSSPNFLPLDSPYARQTDSSPPIFASILRRTTGIKVLECHAFICKREAAANALVRCCFHAYADTMYAKQIGADINNNNNTGGAAASVNGTSPRETEYQEINPQRPQHHTMDTRLAAAKRSKSIAALNETNSNQQHLNETVASYQAMMTMNDKTTCYGNAGGPDYCPLAAAADGSHYAFNCDNSNSINWSGDLKKQQQKLLSKSMHHLNQSGAGMMMQMNDSGGGFWMPHGSRQQSPSQQHQQQQQLQPPFYNPYASRVPSYPPPNLMDSANNGGTLKSIRSMAANSLASTLLRSKKHAKSMAQLNNKDTSAASQGVISFHRPQAAAAHTMMGPLTQMMPPLPAGMFLPPNLPPQRALINGSQTMKVPSRSLVPAMMGQPMTQPMTPFEAMTPKELKKLLKKSAKYGINPNSFADNGLSNLLQPPPPQSQPLLRQNHPSAANYLAAHNGKGSTLPPLPPPSIYSDLFNGGSIDMASLHGLPPPPPLAPPPPPPPPHHQNHHLGGLPMDLMEQQQQQQMAPILVKPNPEFLKSKAGKKWLKQQKEFKKLLPPHLDGLPIIFGPPPIEALELADLPAGGQAIPNMVLHPHQQQQLSFANGLPMMDASGYYSNPHPFYGHNGRASAASTLLRYSPQGMLRSQQQQLHGGHQRRNCMVEQSVISMDDENDDYDEDGNECARQDDTCSSETHGYEPASRRASARSRTTTTGGVSSSQQAAASAAAASARDNGHSAEAIYQDELLAAAAASSDQRHQNYDQISRQTDDQSSSYSSGIYKRGHLNERAFSYSIRQEHKSSSNNNSDSDYANRQDVVGHQHHHQQQQPHHDRANRERKRGHGFNTNGTQRHSGNIYQQQENTDNYYDHDNSSSSNNNNNNLSNNISNHNLQSASVNELTARMDSQLNMRTFSNSRIKSHI